MQYQHFISIVLVLSIGVIAPSLSYSEDNLLNDWKVVKDRKGVKVYMKHTENSKLKTFRGVTEMTPKEPFSVIAALLDFENNHKTFHFVSNVEELKKDTDYSYLARVHTRLPWPVKNREAIARIHISQDPSSLNVLAKIESEATELKVLKGYVRVPEFKGILAMEQLGGNKMKVTYEFVLDPGGYVPLWMVDIVLKDNPYFTLQKLRGFIDRPEYQGIKFDFITYPEAS